MEEEPRLKPQDDTIPSATNLDDNGTSGDNGADEQEHRKEIEEGLFD
jgi:hypothetical protein